MGLDIKLTRAQRIKLDNIEKCECKICRRRPEEIWEYRTQENPVACVKKNEGTYNELTGKFYCTDCYIKVGMPLGKA